VVKHYNTSISEDAARILNSKQGQFLSDDVQGPVATIAINPVCNIVKHNNRSTTGSTTVYTTPSDKDFYLVAIHQSWAADASCDCLEFWVGATNATDSTASTRYMAARRITLTAGRDQDTLVLPFPVRLARNSTITLNQSFTVGSASQHVTIFGYTQETTK